MCGCQRRTLALRPGVARLGELRLDQIVAVELVLRCEPTIRDREQADQPALVGDPGAADGFLVLLAMLREGFDENPHAMRAVFAQGHSVRGDARHRR